MNETVTNLVDAIKSGDALATEQAFAAAMAEKLSSKIEDLRVNIAQNMFAQTQVQEEQISEEEDLALVVEHATDEFDSDEITLSEEEVSELVEKYVGFKKLSGELAAKGAKNPGGLAAWIGRKKYGKEKFQAAAASDHKMNEEQLDEISKDTLKSYVKKASVDAGTNQLKMVRKNKNDTMKVGAPKEGPDYRNIGKQREAGISKALSKM